MERNRNDNNINAMPNAAATFLSNHKLSSMVAIKSNCEFNADLYAMMRENALFLLELSSTNSCECHVPCAISGLWKSIIFNFQS